MRRPLLAAIAGSALFLLAGCAGGPPQVTFAVAGESIEAGPTQYCEDDFVTCQNFPENPVDLPVPPGTALEITVPEQISSTPWQIVFTYRDAGGAQQDERTTVFGPGEQQTYSLELPDPAARLLTAQVQQYGPPPQLNQSTGEVEFPIRSSWVFLNAG